MSIDKINIPEKADNPNKKALLARLGVPQDESLSAQEINRLVGKTNELVEKTNELDQKFDAYKPVNAFNFKENKATYTELTSIVDPQKDDAYGVLADGLIYIYNGTSWPTEGNGLDLGLKPGNGSKVENGNSFAVSGGEVYERVYENVFINNDLDVQSLPTYKTNEPLSLLNLTQNVELSKILLNGYSENFVNPDKIAIGVYFSNPLNTTVSANRNWGISNLISVEPNTEYRKTNFHADEGIWWFDKSGNFISSVKAVTEATSPATARFARLNLRTPFVNRHYFGLKKDYTGYKNFLNFRQSIVGSNKDISIPFKSPNDLENKGIYIDNFKSTIPFPLVWKDLTNADDKKQIFRAEFDFKMPIKMHLDNTERVLFSIGTNKDTVFYRFGVKPTTPTANRFVPNYTAQFFGRGNNTADNILTTYDDIKNQENFFCDRDLFSVRLKSPTSADLNKKIEVNATELVIKDNDTVLFSWTLASYASIIDLIEAMRANSTFNEDYEIINYAGKAEYNKPSDIEGFSAFLAQQRNKYDVTPIETYIDGYEVFLPKKTTAWHKIVFEVSNFLDVVSGDINAFYNTYRVYLNGQLIINKRNTKSILTSDTNLFFNLNFSPVVGQEAPLDAEIRNLKLSHSNTYYQPPRFIVTINHLWNDRNEYDVDGNNATTSAGRLSAFVNEAKANGWKFIALHELEDMLEGNSEIQDKVITFVNDDSRFAVDEIPELKNIFQEERLKIAIAADHRMDFEVRKEQIARMIKSGHTITHHTPTHYKWDELSYEQAIENIRVSKNFLISGGFDSPTMILPHGLTDEKTAKLLQNRGFSMTYLAGGGVEYFGKNKQFMKRLPIDDIVPFENIRNILK